MKTRKHEVAGVPGENGLIPENNFARVEIQTENQMTGNPQHCEMPTTIAQRYHKLMADPWSSCSQLCEKPNPHAARYVYGFIFFLTNLLAWMIRDYGHSALAGLKREYKYSCLLRLQ